jgi:hypothetical protein
VRQTNDVVALDEYFGDGFRDFAQRREGGDCPGPSATPAWSSTTAPGPTVFGCDAPIIEVLLELMLRAVYAPRHVTLREVLSPQLGLPAFTGDFLGCLGYDGREVLRRLRYVAPGGYSARERSTPTSATSSMGRSSIG